MVREQPPIVVVGSINTDLTVQTPHLPAPGETVLGENLVIAGGGKGANQAVAAARLGARVVLVGCVGNDLFGQQARERLAQEGIVTDWLRVDPTAPSGVALIIVDPQGQNMIAVAPGANARLTPDDVARAEPVIAASAVVVLQLETPLPTVVAAARAARRHGRRVILNPAPAQPLPADLYALVDVLVPNAREAAQLSGQDTTTLEGALAAARWFQAQGVRAVVVTLGEQGALLVEGPTWQHVPAAPVAAVDTTAAGDAFVGALAWGLARGQPLPTAVMFASAAAALACTRVGAQPSLPVLAEVEALWRRAYNLSETSRG